MKFITFGIFCTYEYIKIIRKLGRFCLLQTMFLVIFAHGQVSWKEKKCYDEPR